MNAPIKGILTLIVPQMLEEDVVDFFLGQEDPQGFTSLQVRGHSSRHGGMSVIEQVTGRQQMVQFQVLIDQPQVEEICECLKALFPGTGIRYWFLATTLQGSLD